MKRVSAPKRRERPSECHTLHILFDYLWQTFLEQTFSGNQEGAHAFALAEQRLIEIIRHKPEGIGWPLLVLNGEIVRCYNGAYQEGLKQFEVRLAEAFKTEMRAKLKAMRRRSDVTLIAASKRKDKELLDWGAQQRFFTDLWQFLQPAISENPDAGYAITLMHRRVVEAIDRGPKGIVCAISLLTGNIKQAFKHTKAHKEHKVSFNTYVAHLEGDVIPQKSRGLI